MVSFVFLIGAIVRDTMSDTSTEAGHLMNHYIRSVVVVAILLISTICSYAQSGAGLKQVLAGFDFTLVGVALKAAPEIGRAHV